MKTAIILAILSTLALVPTAQAAVVEDIRCTYNPGFVNDEPICEEPVGDDDCDSFQVFVMSDDQCHETSGGGVGCKGIQVFIMSSGNCHGSKGASGCGGVRIYDPFSSGNCVGGPGGLFAALL